MDMPVTTTGMLSSIVETHTMGIKDRPDPDTGAEGYWTKRFRLPWSQEKRDRIVSPKVSPEPITKIEESKGLRIAL